MSKLMATGSVLGSVLVGAVAWFVLFVIIGVALWVSFVVWAAIIVVGVLLAAGRTGGGKSRGQRSGHHHEPGTPAGAK